MCVLSILYLQLCCIFTLCRGLSDCQVLLLCSIISDQVMNFSQSITPTPKILKVNTLQYYNLMVQYALFQWCFYIVRMCKLTADLSHLNHSR